MDLPNLNSDDIEKLNYLMQKHKYKIGTLASPIQNRCELKNKNIVKVETKEILNSSNNEYCKLLIDSCESGWFIKDKNRY